MPDGYSLRIVPSASILRRIRKSAPGIPAVVRPDRDFPVLADVIRSEVRKELGDNAIQPN
jgi:hypothetical protein